MSSIAIRTEAGLPVPALEIRIEGDHFVATFDPKTLPWIDPGSALVIYVDGAYSGTIPGRHGDHLDGDDPPWWNTWGAALVGGVLVALALVASLLRRKR